MPADRMGPGPAPGIGWGLPDATRVAEAEECAARERGLRQQAEDAAATATADAHRATEHAAEVARTATAEADRARLERDQARAAATTFVRIDRFSAEVVG